jgi:hypothetical protein
MAINKATQRVIVPDCGKWQRHVCFCHEHEIYLKQLRFSHLRQKTSNSSRVRIQRNAMSSPLNYNSKHMPILFGFEKTLIRRNSISLAPNESSNQIPVLVQFGFQSDQIQILQYQASSLWTELPTYHTDRTFG